MSTSTTLGISLADLIASLYEDLPDADDLARISESRRRAQALSDLGDQLIDHYVSEAKLGGASWGEIGDALGQSSQVAQRRHAPNAFERFTDLNRQSIVQAQEVARTHQHDLIGTEHLLLGLLSQPRGLAYQVLTEHTGSEQSIRDAIEEAMPPTGTTALLGHIAFGADSAEAIEQAIRAASDLGHDWVGTEHLLLGLIRVEESLAAQILRTLGFTSDTLHATVKTEVTERSATSKG